MLPPFVVEKLDLTSEIPLQRVGNGALPRAVVAVHRDALALPEVHRHLIGNPAERTHHQALNLFTHLRVPRKSGESPGIDPCGRASAAPQTFSTAPAADHPSLRGGQAGTRVRQAES